MAIVLEKPSRRTRRSRRRTTPYALSHLYVEHRTLTWQMRRVIALARDYPCPDEFSTLDAEQSAVLTTFADRMKEVYDQLLATLTPHILAAMQHEHATFEKDMARYDKFLGASAPVSLEKEDRHDD